MTLEYLEVILLDAPGLLLYDPSLGFVAPSLQFCCLSRWFSSSLSWSCRWSFWISLVRFSASAWDERKQRGTVQKYAIFPSTTADPRITVGKFTGRSWVFIIWSFSWIFCSFSWSCCLSSWFSSSLSWSCCWSFWISLVKSSFSAWHERKQKVQYSIYDCWKWFIIWTN